MKLSYRWIQELVPDYKGSPADLAKLLTFSGTEIEGEANVGDDVILEAAVTSNRVDCLGHLGLAREIAAAAGVAMKPPPTTAMASGASTAKSCRTQVLAPELCPRLTVRVIEGLTVKPSPPWLLRRLEALGLRPVNNVVDVTNLVLWEWNQPLHAYDLDTLKGPAVIARRAQPGEKCRLINGQDVVFTGEDLVIADDARAIGLAGIMGGIDTEVSERTTRIALESAYFTPTAIRASARRHRLRTDASFRFERGIDRNAALLASERAARLILEVAGGRLATEPIDIEGRRDERSSIRLRTAQVSSVAGFTPNPESIPRLLTALGCSVSTHPSGFDVNPPTFRVDLSREIDLIEEIVRLLGLDNVPATTRMLARATSESPARALREDLRDRMVAMGFLESVTPDFIREGRLSEVAFLTQGFGLRVRNPVRAGEGALRRSLLPSLLQVRKHNADHGAEDLAFFEVTNLRSGEKEALPEHVPALAFLMDGDFRAARGVVEEIFRRLGIAPKFAALAHRDLDPAASAAILCEGTRVGVLGYPARDVLKESGLKARPLFCELALAPLRAAQKTERKFRGLPRFPAITRDLAVILAEDVSYAALEAAVKEAAPEHLESLELFDEFRGSQIGEGRKSLALRFVFRCKDSTLTSEVVESTMERIMNQLGAQVRGEIRKG